MIKYTFDYQQSKELYEKYKKRISVKGCYENIFNVVTSEREKFESGEWKVAYGAMPSIENIMIRHCFIVDKDRNAIDPTLFASKSELKDETVYMAHTVYKSLSGYISAIKDNNYIPDLIRTLRTEDMTAYKSLKEKGYVYIGW